MAQVFEFPDVGEGITEGEVKKWLVESGEEVQEDQALMEVETDKAVVELPSPYGGTLLKRHVEEGDVIHVDEPLATIGEEGETVEEPEEAVEARGEGAPEEGTEATAEAPPEAPKAETGGGEVLATPKVRKLAEEKGVELASVEGTGPGGRVTEEDLERAAGGEAAEEEEAEEGGAKVTRKYDMYGYVDRRPMKGIRRTTAERMQEASEAPLVTHQDEADVTEMADMRRRINEEQDHIGVHVTYMPFIVKAAIEGLKEEPTLNSELDEENNEIVVKDYYNVGIAVATDDGLLVPVVKRAEEKSIVDIGREIRDLAEQAGSREIDLADMKGGSFTVTNYGAIGGTYGTPIVNPPETAILGVGRVDELPRVVDGEVVPRKVLPLSLTFDHRVADGAQAARCVNEMIRHLENPEMLAIE